MLKTRPTCAVGILSLTMLLAAPSGAFALSFPLSRPEVSLSAKSKLNAKEVMKVLAHSKYKFVSGWTGGFAGSTLCYSGTTDDLTGFLDDLAHVKRAIISLSFSKDRGVATSTVIRKRDKKVSYQWRVSHFNDRFEITVYLGDGTIKKEDVDIPVGVATQPVKKTNTPAKPNKK